MDNISAAEVAEEMGGGVNLEDVGLTQLEAENTAIDELDAEDVHLFFVAIDESASMNDHASDMREALKDFKDAIINSKESDHILLAQARFSDAVQVGGYKKIEEFDTGYKIQTMTALYDAIVQGQERLIGTLNSPGYMTHLKNGGIRVKAVFVVFSDGNDNNSLASITETKAAVAALNNAEVTTAFITFGPNAEGIASDLGFVNNLKVGGSASELREAMKVLSKSVIEASKSILPDTDKFYV